MGSGNLKQSSALTKKLKKDNKTCLILSNFFKIEELEVLKSIFKDLCLTTCNKELLEKSSFMSFVKLPVKFIQGLLGKKVFCMFAKTLDGKLNFNEFCIALKTFCDSDREHFLKLFFKVCDFEDRQIIQKSDLEIIVYDI
jgi:Ca2+-binding EF-hand superfamily protein